MTLTRREKTMIFVGIIVVTLVAYIFYFLIPYQGKLSAASTQLNAAQQQLNQLKTRQVMVPVLQGQIDDLNNQLKSKGSSVPQGVDHAKILRYLQKITDGRGEFLTVSIPDEATLENKFLIQSVAVDFQTDYADFLNIIADLKKNELFNTVSYLKVTYTPALAQPDQGDASAQPAATAGKYSLVMHLELGFYSLPAPTGAQASGAPSAQPSSTPAPTRSSSLMPE